MKLRVNDFRVRPGAKVTLDEWPTRVKPYCTSKESYHQLMAEHVETLSALQRLHYASDRHALLLVFQGMDAAGKDGAIRHVMSGVNPQGCEVFSFKQPSAEELQHDFLWRTTRRLPERGRIGIFNRSYYEEVLVVRVHPELLASQNLPDHVLHDKNLWKHRYRSIKDLETHLHRNGTRVVKIFLHLSKDEQRNRFLARLDEPDKNWKFSEADIHERTYWKKYQSAYGECLQATSTHHAPWYVVPADDKDDARLIVSRIAVDALQHLRMAYPKPTAKRRRELAAIGRELADPAPVAGMSRNGEYASAGQALRSSAHFTPGVDMKATRQLHEIGQSLWLDNITRGILDDGTLQRYIQDLSVTGLTSNPTIFDHAIKQGTQYDDAIRTKGAQGKSGESLFFELAIEDLRRAADLFRPVHDMTNGVDGWVSLEVSPLLANDAPATIRAAAQLHAQADRPNLFIKIPGTPEGVHAIEESILAGVAVNVTLLFSAAQYVAAAEAYMRGIERRLAAGLDPRVRSVASIFVSRWDVAMQEKVPVALHNRLGIAIAQRTYREYRRVLSSTRWRELVRRGAMPQRLLWASTGTKDPAASDTLYVEALAAPDTINTIPEKTLLAFADHGRLHGQLQPDAADADAVLTEFAAHGVNAVALAARLQREGAASFDASWKDLLQCLAAKQATLTSPS